jgi:hypothetical protein
MLYGKMELYNTKKLYSHIVNDFGSLNEHHYIGRADKIEYSAKAIDETIIIWLPK